MFRMTEQFLVESLLADALLLERWGSRPVDTTAKLQNSSSCGNAQGQLEALALSVKERRRLRNREYMQRTRQTQRNSIERMRRQLDELTLEFEQLQIWQQSQLRPMSSSDHAQRLRLQAAYTMLAETSHRLKAESFWLQRQLVEHDKTRLRLLGTVNIYEKSPSRPVKFWPDEVVDQATIASYEYLPISLNRAQDVINACYRDIIEYERNAQPLGHWIVDASEPGRTFGWTVTCEISKGNNFLLCMRKRLSSVSAQEAMQRAWRWMSHARMTDKSPTRRIVRSDLVQVLNDSTCVVANDWHHPLKPGTCMRSISVRFKLSTSDGFAIGLGTLNPQDPMVRNMAPPGVEWMDRSEWHTFADSQDGSGCTVTIKSLTKYDTREDHRLRLVNVLCCRWSWENDVILGPRRLLAG